MTLFDLGRRAYSEYAAVLADEKYPEWHKLPGEYQIAWCSAAANVVENLSSGFLELVKAQLEATPMRLDAELAALTDEARGNAA